METEVTGMTEAAVRRQAEDIVSKRPDATLEIISVVWRPYLL